MGVINSPLVEGGVFSEEVNKKEVTVNGVNSNKNRTFVLFSYINLYTFKNLFDIIGTVTRTNSKNMTGPEVSIFRYFRVLFYPQILVL